MDYFEALNLKDEYTKLKDVSRMYKSEKEKQVGGAMVDCNSRINYILVFIKMVKILLNLVNNSAMYKLINYDEKYPFCKCREFVRLQQKKLKKKDNITKLE